MMISGAGTKHYFHQNHLYSVAAMTNSTGAVVERYRYDAYGKRTVTNAAGTTIAASTIGQQRGFTGYHLDAETGFYYARNRMYSAGLGRFVSRDPIVSRADRPTVGDGYVNGLSLYAAWFIPHALDPMGTATWIPKKTLGNDFSGSYNDDPMLYQFLHYARSFAGEASLYVYSSVYATAYFGLWWRTGDPSASLSVAITCDSDGNIEYSTTGNSQREVSIGSTAIALDATVAGKILTIRVASSGAMQAGGGPTVSAEHSGVGVEITWPDARASNTFQHGTYKWHCICIIP